MFACTRQITCLLCYAQQHISSKHTIRAHVNMCNTAASIRENAHCNNTISAHNVMYICTNSKQQADNTNANAAARVNSSH